MNSETFPLVYPGNVRPLLSGEVFTRRMAKTLGITSGTRVLVIGPAMGAVIRVVGEELGAKVTAFDPTKGDPHRALPFEDRAFDVVFVDVIPAKPLDVAVTEARRLLAKNGHLCIGYPVRVGRNAHAPALGFWERRLGEPLRLPRECLGLLEQRGYEPILVEALDDPGLEAFYRSVELASIEGAEQRGVLHDELAQHRAQAGRASVTFAIMIGRRKEPGEKPPPPRHE